ncbi:MAG TPA: condensation domain-containing protein [Streptosporangiaceae bacterium]|nr:condensation domain-containing protein [Streptosporangiaceae bacterium]
MNEPVDHRESSLKRYPLSDAQHWFCDGDQGDEAGTFANRFTVAIAVRISGRVDVGALQGGLCDIVRRHEILRTIVVQDAKPRYQQVYPPAPAALEVRDLPPVQGKSRDAYAQETIIRAARRRMDVRTLPLLRAELNRFDDQDSVLIVCSHHSAVDGWSMSVIVRDLATFYKARSTGCQVEVPDGPQYRDFVAWQRARCKGPGAARRLEYWTERLSGARIFSPPTNGTVPGPDSRPYSAYYFTIDPTIAAETIKLSTVMRSSVFMILLAAFNVLAHEIAGTTDPVVNTFSSGRSDPSIYNIVGPVVNVLPLRTNMDSCLTFRDVVRCTRQTCLGAYSHDIPTALIEEQAPTLNDAPDGSGRCNFFAFSMFQPHVNDAELGFADSSYRIRKEIVQDEPESQDLAEGFRWDMDMLPSGEITCSLRYHPGEYDKETVMGWLSAYHRILSGAVVNPDGEWKKLLVTPIPDRAG